MPTSSLASPATPTPGRTLVTARRVQAGVLVALALALSGCGSAAPTPDVASASPTSSPTTAATHQPTSSPASGSARPASCSERALLAVLPNGATMLRYTCARTGGAEWAAARVNPGSTVFFLRWQGSRWTAEEASDVCGTASAGLPPNLLDYCTPTRSPSTRPTTPAKPTTAVCTSTAILATLPNGATMRKFTCAKVGGTEWAAARVDPGNTVFFLRWRGTGWTTEESSDVCGTASAGLPPSLLAYCR